MLKTILLSASAVLAIALFTATPASAEELGYGPQHQIHQGHEGHGHAGRGGGHYRHNHPNHGRGGHRHNRR